MRRTVAFTVLGVAVAAAVLLIAVEAGAPLGGLTHAQASAAARDAIAGTGPLSERWALPGPFFLFRGNSTDAVSPWRRMVWAVTLDGSFRSRCGPLQTSDEPIRCPTGHTALVIVDYMSGEFIQADFGP